MSLYFIALLRRFYRQQSDPRTTKINVDSRKFGDWISSNFIPDEEKNNNYVYGRGGRGGGRVGGRARGRGGRAGRAGRAGRGGRRADYY